MIIENIKILEERIEKISGKSGRNPADIKTIVVTKTQPVEIMKEVLDAGVLNLGENKAQELRDKAGILKGNIKWHFIGHLQTNKIKYIIDKTEYIHSVESLNLAQEINNKAAQLNKIQNILLEIKTSDEATKYGLEDENEIYRLADFCRSSANLNLAGLMTMAPYTEDENKIRHSFKTLRELKDKMNKDGFSLTELSMGMTNDYKIAIEEGATMIRIGTAIFGERNYN